MNDRFTAVVGLLGTSIVAAACCFCFQRALEIAIAIRDGFTDQQIFKHKTLRAQQRLEARRKRT
jgi:hypothetical protein